MQMKYPPHMFSPGSVTVMLNGDARTIASDHPSYAAVVEALKNKAPLEELEILLDKAKAVAKFTNGKITVEHGSVYYQGEVVHNTVTERILQFMQEQLPFEPLIRFLEKLLENPSKRSLETLYQFLEKWGLPICEDGDFLAYKAVRPDFRDKHSGKFDNSPGKILEVPRNSVDDDPSHGCSYGFHVGAIEYVRTFGHIGSDKFLICKVNPKDVVSVPYDCNFQKVRTCRYEVLKEYEGDLEAPLYRNDGSDYEARNGFFGGEDDEDEDDYTPEETCPHCDSEDFIILRSKRRVCRDCEEEWDEPQAEDAQPAAQACAHAHTHAPQHQPSKVYGV